MGAWTSIWGTPAFVTEEILDLHAVLVSLVPGFDSVRGVARFSVALQVALSILAGVGAALPERNHLHLDVAVTRHRFGLVARGQDHAAVAVRRVGL